jgi:hypothetical protein
MEDIHSALLNLSHRILFFKCYTICFLFIGIWFKWARLTFCFHHLLQGKSSLCTKGVYLGIFTLAHRSICSRCVNQHFEVSKNCKIKFSMYIYIFYVRTQVFKKKLKTIVAPVKKTSFDAITRLRT